MTKFEICDEQIEMEITESVNEDMKIKLLDLWKTETKYEMDKSGKILEKKREWLNDYEKNYGKETTKKSSNTQRNHNGGNVKSGYRNNGRPSYASVVRENVTQNANSRKFNNYNNRPTYNRNRPFHRRSNNRRNLNKDQYGNVQQHNPQNNEDREQHRNWNQRPTEPLNINGGENQTRNNPENHFLWRGRFHRRRQKTFRFHQL